MRDLLGHGDTDMQVGELSSAQVETCWRHGLVGPESGPAW